MKRAYFQSYRRRTLSRYEFSNIHFPRVTEICLDREDLKQLGLGPVGATKKKANDEKRARQSGLKCPLSLILDILILVAPFFLSFDRVTLLSLGFPFGPGYKAYIVEETKHRNN